MYVFEMNILFLLALVALCFPAVKGFTPDWSSVSGDISHIVESHGMHTTTTCLGNTPTCNGENTAQDWYNKLPEKPKLTLRSRMYILANDAGNSTSLSATIAQGQYEFLNTYFEDIGIQFEPIFSQINNTFYFERLAFPLCDFADIGDGVCDFYCNASVSNFDGGDCISVPSNLAVCAQSNGVCNQECNYPQYNWDHGDCCLPDIAATSCVNPNSNLTRYYDPSVLKAIPTLQTDSWNVYVAIYAKCSMCGALSTFPWDYNKDSVLDQGTTYNALLTSKSFGYFVGGHELGHTFGLLHPFANGESGVKSQACSDPCFEGTQYPIGDSGSTTIGDLIADTRPMSLPPSYTCANPPGTDCNNVPWVDTPFRNLMTFGYMSVGCVNISTAFTPQQKGRMRCYLEGAYPNWVISSTGGSSSSSNGTLSPGAIGIVVAAVIAIIIAVGVRYAYVSKGALGPTKHIDSDMNIAL